MVTFEEAENFWKIVPDSMLREQAEQEREKRLREKAELLKRDRAEKEEAEMMSNIGIATKGEDGHWHPLMDETAAA